MRLGEAAGLPDDGLPRATRPLSGGATPFAHAYLKELILDLTLEPGTIITEMDVARATGLSRTPIREALLRLHEERLVELIPRRGALIPWVTTRQVRELYEVRLLLESRAAEIICEESILVADALVELCVEQETLYEEGAPPTALIRIDRRFHSRLIAAAGNTVMETVNESLGDHNQRTGVISFSLDRHRCKVATDQHREIADALRIFDVVAAKDAIERHLVVGGHELERLLRH